MKVSAAMTNHCMVGVNCLKYGYALALLLCKGDLRVNGMTV